MIDRSERRRHANSKSPNIFSQEWSGSRGIDGRHSTIEALEVEADYWATHEFRRAADK